jgi:hypothetical protein
MREYLELRVKEKRASEVFAANEGKRLGSLVRLVVIPMTDPRLPDVKRLDAEGSVKHDYFFYGWRIVRKYSCSELANAELFQITITTAFEPAGEECGTVYDDSGACKHVFCESDFTIQGFTSILKDSCGVGSKQVSELVLDANMVPRKDIARTIAGEIVVSDPMDALLRRSDLTGFELRPVRGRPSRRISRAPRIPWSQFAVTSRPVSATPETCFGIGPFDPDENGKYRCPFGHVAGLNLQSEVTVLRSEWDGCDFFTTKQFYGVRRGLLRPMPAILVTPRVRQLWKKENMRGCTFEVAHFR